MNKIALCLAIGATVVLGSSAATASEKLVGVTIKTDVTSQLTDVSSQRRHYRHRHYHRRGYGYYAPRAYYAPQPYYGGSYYAGPSVSFGFGGLGLGGGHHHHHGRYH